MKDVLTKLSCVVLLPLFFNMISTNSLYGQEKNKSSKNYDSKTSSSKNYSVEWGQEVKLNWRYISSLEPLFFRDGNFYVLQGQPGLVVSDTVPVIAKINSNLEPVLIKKIDLEKSDKSMSFLQYMNILVLNNGLWLLTREIDTKNKKVCYFLDDINLNTLEAKGNKKKIYETDYSQDTKRRDVKIIILQPEDKDILVIYDKHAMKKDEKIVLTVTALDKSLTGIWKKEFAMPLQEEDQSFDFDKYIDPSGNLYLHAKVFSGNDKKHKDVVNGQLNYDYHIYMIGKNIETYIDYPLGLKDKAVAKMQLGVNKQGLLTACGFYSDINKEKDKLTLAKGIFSFVIDPATKAIKVQNYKKFDTKTLTAGLSAKDAAKLEQKPDEDKLADDKTYYKIKELIQRKDGGHVMLVEECQKLLYPDGYMYNRKNIFIIKISAAGEIEWTSVIPKSQLSFIDDWAGSFTCLDRGNDTYDFFFNDHADNLIDEKVNSNGVESIRVGVKNTKIVHVSLNQNGDLSKKEAASNLKDETFIVASVSHQIDDRNLIVCGFKGSDMNCAKISFIGPQK